MFCKIRPYEKYKLSKWCLRCKAALYCLSHGQPRLTGHCKRCNRRTASWGLYTQAITMAITIIGVQRCPSAPVKNYVCHDCIDSTGVSHSRRY